MTLKHINFLDSEVLRNLEAKYLEKQPKMVKKAEAAEVEISFEPSEDLFNDLVRLADGLRCQGLINQADELEQKLHLRQAAKKELEKIQKDEGEKFLDMAHPEGDVEVAPSASGLGKVWTEQSAHKEIRRIVEKTPTGKQAKLNKILEASKNVLIQKKASTDMSANEAFQWLKTQLMPDSQENIEIVSWYNTGGGHGDDSVMDVAQEMATQYNKDVKTAEKLGMDADSFWKEVSTTMLRYKFNKPYFQTGSVSPLHYRGDFLNVGRLYGDVVRKLFSKLQQSTASKKTKGHELILSELKNIGTQLIRVYHNEDKSQHSRDQALANAKFVKKVHDALRDSQGYYPAFLMGLKKKDVSEEFVNAVPDLNSLTKEVESLVDVLTDFIKTSSFLGVKKADDLKEWEQEVNPQAAQKGYLPKIEKKKETTEDKPIEVEVDIPRVAPVQHGAGSAPVGEMQQALIDLSNAFKDRKMIHEKWYGPIGAVSSHGRPDNDWGSRTDTALETAQKAINVLNKGELNVQEKLKLDRNPANAKDNTAILKKVIEAVKNWKGTGPVREAKGEELGSYDIAGRQVTITESDLGSLNSFLNMLAEYGLVDDVREGRTADDRAVAREASRKEEWRKLAQEFQFLTELNERTKQHEKLHGKKDSFDFEFDFSLPLGRWKELLVSLFQQAKQKFEQGTKSAQEVAKLRKLSNMLRGLYQKLEQTAKQQGTDPKDPASNSVAIAPGARPGRQGGRGRPGAGYRQSPEGQDLEGRSVSTAEDIAAIGKTLDLRQDAWGMPPEYAQVIEWTDFNRTHATRLAARMFSRLSRSPRKAQERLIKLHGLQPMKYVSEDRMYRVYVRGKGVMRLDKALGPDYSKQLRQAQGTSALREFQEFLSLLNRKISDVGYEFSQMEDNPQLVNQANRWASRWEDVISRKYQQTKEALSSGELG